MTSGSAYNNLVVFREPVNEHVGTPLMTEAAFRHSQQEYQRLLIEIADA